MKEMSNGKECTCFASCYNECSCGADWTPDEVVRLRAENAALSEQNTKMREVLEFYMENGITEPLYYKAKKALALPDLAAHAISRIKAEAYRECAEWIGLVRDDWVEFNDNHKACGADYLSCEIRYKADELEGKK